MQIHFPYWGEACKFDASVSGGLVYFIPTLNIEFDASVGEGLVYFNIKFIAPVGEAWGMGGQDGLSRLLF